MRVEDVTWIAAARSNGYTNGIRFLLTQARGAPKIKTGAYRIGIDMRTFLVSTAFSVATLFATQSMAQSDLLRGAVEQLGRVIAQEGLQTNDTRRPQQTDQSRQPALTSSRVDVAEVQSMLNRLGYDAGPADGLMGPRTATAIRAYQSANGLTSTGRPNTALSNALRASLSDTQSTTQQAASDPSFDCAKAGTPPERAICASQKLAGLDRAVARAYRVRIKAAAQPGQVRRNQRAWLRTRNACGGGQACLAETMRNRIAALGGDGRMATTHPAEAVATTPLGNIDSTGNAGPEPTAQSAMTDGPDPADQSAEGGLLRHSSGRILINYPFYNEHSPEGRQFLRVRQYLAHAKVGAFPTLLDDRVAFAAALTDYLPAKATSDYLCGTMEMVGTAKGCLSLGQAAMKAGSIATGRRIKSKTFKWWRGANEFARRKSEQAARDAGLAHRIIDAAPSLPVKLIYVINSNLGDYNFESGRFSVNARLVDLLFPTRRHIQVPVRVDQPGLEIPEAQAQAFREALEERSPDGRPVYYTAVKVEATPLGPSASRPWKIEVGKPELYADRAATIPLRSVLPGGAPQAAGAEPGDTHTDTLAEPVGKVLRPFDALHTEDGRIVIHVSFKDPGPADLEAADYIVAAAHEDFRDILDNYKSGQLILYELLRSEMRQKYFACWQEHSCKGSYKGFLAASEFDARKLRKGVIEDLLPRVAAEAPKFPIPVRQLSVLRLPEYDFDRGGFAVNLTNGGHFRIGASFFDLTLGVSTDDLPGFLKIGPADAEALLNKASDRQVVLRLDYDIEALRLRNYEGPDMVTTPVSMALLAPSKGKEVLYRQDLRPDTPQSRKGEISPAARFLGPAAKGAPSALSDKQLLGVSVGMPADVAQQTLESTSDSASIERNGDILSNYGDSVFISS